MKLLSILGSTGSIGASTLRVVEAHPDRFRVVALGAGRNVDALAEQVRRHRPERVAVADGAAASRLRERVGPAPEILHGVDGLVALASARPCDLVVNGLVGALGVRPTFAAVDAGIPVALANKEALVVAGAPITARARETGAAVLPVDSEHNALHQCLRGERPEEVRRLWLTASGGPFRTLPRERLADVRPAEALRHPTWTMGRKITIDSATLMNKGLEVIEARWLFDVGPDRIRVVVHPQSVVHSMVELVDGSFKAQLGVTDMRHPIQYALTWPERVASPLPPFDPMAVGRLDFESPDVVRFPCLELGYRAISAGGAAPAVLNAANEVAVAAFLDGAARFTDIPRVVEHALERWSGLPAEGVDALLDADRRARAGAARMLAEGVRP